VEENFFSAGAVAKTSFEGGLSRLRRCLGRIGREEPAASLLRQENFIQT
jgi:hypothetical protein